MERSIMPGSNFYTSLEAEAPRRKGRQSKATAKVPTLVFPVH